MRLPDPLVQLSQLSQPGQIRSDQARPGQAAPPPFPCIPAYGNATLACPVVVDIRGLVAILFVLKFEYSICNLTCSFPFFVALMARKEKDGEGWGEGVRSFGDN